MGQHIDGKLYLSADELLIDSFKLGKQIIESGFRPDFIAAVWRGGTFPGTIVQELLSYKGIKTDHISIRTSRYNNEQTDVENEVIKVYGLNYLVDNMNAENKLLIVDDVYDKGLSLQAVYLELKEKMRKNLPHDIRMATVYFKPERNETYRKPDFYVHETNDWIIFPHELADLKQEELKNKNSDIANIVNSIQIL